MNRATTRTCDAMGVCQGRAQPCNGCMPAPRRSHHVCSADQCQQGRAACPCPTACELPEPAHMPADPPATSVERAGIALVLLACFAGAIFAIKTAIGA